MVIIFLVSIFNVVFAEAALPVRDGGHEPRERGAHIHAGISPGQWGHQAGRTSRKELWPRRKMLQPPHPGQDPWLRQILHP